MAVERLSTRIGTVVEECMMYGREVKYARIARYQKV